MLQTAPVEPNLQALEEEHVHFQELLRRNPVDGLFFLTGGLGQAELTKRVRPNGYDLYEMASGPLTAPAAASPESAENNYFREPGTIFKNPNYVLFRIQGPKEARQIQIVLYDAENNPAWERIIPAGDLASDLRLRSAGAR